jgi:UDP-3-O-[3-hydroxymyristoyl] glucosamine N-acyltransferase
MVTTVADIAVWVGGTVEGDGATPITGVLGLEEAGPEHVSFLANRRYVRLLRTSRAGAVFVNATQNAFGRTVIRCADPYLAFARVLERFHPRDVPTPGVHPSAVVLGIVRGASVMALAYVGPGATVGEGTVLHPHSHVGANARVGRDCVIMSGAVVADGCVVGDRVWLNPGAVVGAEGFGFVPTPAGHHKIPQTGRAVIEDDVEIGANSNVDRAAVGDTVVGRGSKIDNLVQIGHGATVGPDALLVAYAGVAGSARLGRGVVLAARAGVLGHLEVGDGVQIGACGLLTEDAPAGARRSGIPAIEHTRWLRVAATLPDLPDIETRLRRLEARVGKLEDE